MTTEEARQKGLIKVGTKVIANDNYGAPNFVGTIIHVDISSFTIKRDDGLVGMGYKDNWLMTYNCSDVWFPDTKCKKFKVTKLITSKVIELRDYKNNKFIAVTNVKLELGKVYKIKYYMDSNKLIIEGTI